MLTPTNKRNIKNFENLNANHQRVFKCRLIKKCGASFQEIEFVLRNYKKLGIKIEKVVDIVQLATLLELYSKLNLLQNM
ncbi:hypothetical protein HN903_02065 [archaeon]|jgi:hypothetical protein|nr:hypothetical protein [archaeon]MBT7128518.1 hypothetical protein [archaeon]